MTKMFEGHTPGPWTVTDDVSGNHHCPHDECPHDFDAEGSWSLEGPPTTGWVGDHDTSLARRVDAELAAAAPDLLAIVRAMMLPHEPVMIRAHVLDARQLAMLREIAEQEGAR